MAEMSKLLTRAKQNSNDEFYTMYETIEKELVHYKNQLKDKIIYCPCDNPKVSNFWKYFNDNFKELGIKQLMASYYDENNESKLLTRYEDGVYVSKPLNNDGDFRKNIDLIKKADVIITNPPFSLYREFIDILDKNNKDYLVIANMLSIGYKEIFPLIKDNKMHIGMTLDGIKCKFIVPDDFERDDVIVEDSKKYAFINNTLWFTSLETDRNKCNFFENHEIVFYEHFEDKYEIYDNLDAINIDKVKDIPIDFDGVMGVPITFLKEFNPNEFEIVGFRKGRDGRDLCINGQDLFNRVLIKNKNPLLKENRDFIKGKIDERLNRKGYQLSIFDFM